MQGIRNTVSSSDSRDTTPTRAQQKIGKKLKVYTSTDHPHKAQRPEPLRTVKLTAQGNRFAAGRLKEKLISGRSESKLWHWPPQERDRACLHKAWHQ